MMTIYPFSPPLSPVSGDLVALFVFKVLLFVLRVLTESSGLYIFRVVLPETLFCEIQCASLRSRVQSLFDIWQRKAHNVMQYAKQNIQCIRTNMQYTTHNRQYMQICNTQNAIFNSLSLMCKMQYATPNFNQVHFYDEGSREMRSLQAHLSDPSHTGRCTNMKYATSNKYIRIYTCIKR